MYVVKGRTATSSVIFTWFPFAFSAPVRPNVHMHTCTSTYTGLPLSSHHHHPFCKLNHSQVRAPDSPTEFLSLYSQVAVQVTAARHPLLSFCEAVVLFRASPSLADTRSPVPESPAESSVSFPSAFLLHERVRSKRPPLSSLSSISAVVHADSSLISVANLLPVLIVSLIQFLPLLTRHLSFLSPLPLSSASSLIPLTLPQK